MSNATNSATPALHADRAALHATTAKKMLFREWDPLPLLGGTADVRVNVTCNNLVVARLRIEVCNTLDESLVSAGLGEGMALSSAHGAIEWMFAPAALADPRYVKWNLWVEYPGDDERAFSVVVTVTQGYEQWICEIPGTIPARGRIMFIAPDSDFIAIRTPL